MEPSSSSPPRATPHIVWLDRLALLGIALGMALYLLPVPGTLMLGFWLTLAFTALHIYTSHQTHGPTTAE